MTKPPFSKKPAHQLVPSTPTSHQPRAWESALVKPPRDSATSTSHGGNSAGTIIEEDDLVDPSGLIDDVIQRLFRLLDELEQAAGSDMAPASALALLPQLSELLAMRKDLRVGMDIDDWMSILFRTAEISCAIGSVREELDGYLSRGGFACSDQPDAEPAGQ
jgi:hypothetical protein